MSSGIASFGRRVRASLRAPALAVALVVLAGAPLSAQPAFTVSLGRAFNALTVAPDIARRQTTAASIEAEHQFASERLRLFYELDAGTFTTEGDWHYSLHTAGLTYRLRFGPDDRNTFYLTGSGAWRTNGVDWGAAGFRAVGLRANVEMKPAATAAVRFGYRLDARTFPDLAALDQVEHDGFLSILVNLPTRTTLVGEVHAGVKSYAAYALAGPHQAATTDVSHAGRYGRGMGPGLRASNQTPLAQSSQPPFPPGTRAGQVTWLARLAQSLTDRTGLTLQVAQRGRFGQVPPVLITTPSSFFDDGVYDDPFASNAQTVSAGVKRQFARGIAIEGFTSLARKDYAGAMPLDLMGLPITGALRADRIVRAGAGGTLPLFPAKTGAVALDLNIDYFLVRHRSNDAFYNYTSHGVGIGVSMSY